MTLNNRNNNLPPKSKTKIFLLKELCLEADKWLREEKNAVWNILLSYGFMVLTESLEEKKENVFGVVRVSMS